MIIGNIEGSGSFLKKEPKNFLSSSCFVVEYILRRWAGVKQIKVLWFFSSEKNSLLASGTPPRDVVPTTACRKSNHIRIPNHRFAPDVETLKDDEAETVRGLNETFDKILNTIAKDYGHSVRAVHAILQCTLTIDPDSVGAPSRDGAPR